MSKAKAVLADIVFAFVFGAAMGIVFGIYF